MLSLLYTANISNLKSLKKISKGLSVIINLIYKPIITRLTPLISISYISLFILLPFLIGFILPWDNQFSFYISLCIIWGLYVFFSKITFIFIDCFFKILALSPDLEINQKIQKAKEISKYLLSNKLRRFVVYFLHASVIISINITKSKNPEFECEMLKTIEPVIIGSISTFYAIDRIFDTFKETKHKFCITKKRLNHEVRNDLRTFKKVE